VCGTVIACMAVVAACLAPAAGMAADGATPQRPNVVLIMADDLGWGDVSCNGATRVRTPCIDRLAREGHRFTSGYSSASTCTPTRFSLLTGIHAFRRRGTGIAPPNAACIIPPGTATLPALLRRAGYATAIVGKWHLGLGAPGVGPDWNGRLAPGPLEHGFDHCLVLPTTNDRVPPVLVEDRHVRGLDPADPLWVGDRRPAPDHVNGVDHRDRLVMDWSHGHNGSIHEGIGRIGFFTGGTAARFRDEDLATTWVTESVRWIEARVAARPAEPFFLFLAPHDLHVPRVPHERFRGATPLGPRGDCIVEFDWTVGQVTAAVERLGIAERTLVIVCSDNGPVLDDGYQDGAVERLGDHRPAGPYRGGKADVYEGGTRTPLVTWWPGTIPPGTSAEIVCTIDLAASLAALVGQPVGPGEFPDSVDVLDALLGRAGARGREALVLQDNGGSGRYGYRAGRWKLVRLPGRKPADALYDLEADPGETTDLRRAHADVVARLGADLDTVLAAPRARR